MPHHPTSQNGWKEYRAVSLVASQGLPVMSSAPAALDFHPETEMIPKIK